MSFFTLWDRWLSNLELTACLILRPVYNTACGFFSFIKKKKYSPPPPSHSTFASLLFPAEPRAVTPSLSGTKHDANEPIPVKISGNAKIVINKKRKNRYDILKKAV